MSARRIITCADCGRDKGHAGRQLCVRCWYRHRAYGDLNRYPTTKIPSADLTEDWDFLRRQGYTRALAAERMGITKKRLEKAIERVARRMAEAS